MKEKELVKTVIEHTSNIDNLDKKKVDISKLKELNSIVESNMNEIEVQKKRIDKLTRLEEGSTTGDAELKDIRVGVDRRTYPTAGDAVRNQIRPINEKLEIKNKYDSIDLNIGRYTNVNPNIDPSMTNWVASKKLELNVGDVFTFDNSMYIAQLDIFPNLTDVYTTVSSDNISGKIIIEKDGIYAIQLYKKGSKDFTQEELLIARDKVSLNSFRSMVVNRIENKIEELNEAVGILKIDCIYLKYKVDGTNGAWFHSENFKVDSSIKVTFMEEYGSLTITNVGTKKVTTLTNGDIFPSGTYYIQGFSYPIKEVTDIVLEKVKRDICISINDEKIIFTKSGIESGQARIKPIMNGNTQEVTQEFISEFKYPTLPVWGWEYLNHWYSKVYEAENNATVVWSGDSTVEGFDPSYSGVNDTFKDQVGYAVKKIMKAGGYPLEKLSMYNEGHCGRNTSEWVGDEEYALPNWKEQYPNGFLDSEMSHNPDLLIIRWGLNDADKTHVPFQGLTTEGRLKLFETHMREALKRIRGNVNVNGRPCYNKQAKDLSIIICTPNVGGGILGGRGNTQWNQYVREVIRPLCREFECAFADFTLKTYANNDMIPRYWSCLNSEGGYDNIHPNKYQNAMIISTLQDLIYPVCMWNLGTIG